jgi:hypothetical protein
MDMRRKGSGTFDTTTKTWRLRTKGVQVSVKQLSDKYGIPITPTKQGSLAYWRKYLQEWEDTQQAVRKASSPLQERIRSIEAMIERLKAEGLPTTELEAALTVAVNTPPHDIDAADIPVYHPQAHAAARSLGIDEADGYDMAMLANLIPARPKPAKDSIRHEASVFRQRYEAKKHKGRFQVRQAVDLFLSITGDISIHGINVHHYRQYRQAVIDHASWGARTKVNILRTVKQLLKRIEVDHGVNYSFLRNPDYNLPEPDGQKVQYTLEQVKTALAHAQGDIRLALLLGLNTGAYWGDMKLLTPDNLQSNHLRYARAKLKHKANPVTGSWLLWGETQKCLKFPVQAGWKMQGEYTAFRRKYDLPEHKALRKTVAQLIQDHVGETEARLYRCETAEGTHGKNYIRAYTPEQVAKLDAALRTVGKLLGIE